MKLTWQLTPPTIEKAKKIFTLHEAGVKYDDIVKVIGNNKTYIVELCSWYKKYLKGMHE